MVERMDLFHLPFYRKEAFTGSDRGVRFWIGRTDAAGTGEDGQKESVLRTIMWPEPFSLKSTPDEEKIQEDFAFSEEGLDAAYEWIMGKGREDVLRMSQKT